MFVLLSIDIGMRAGLAWFTGDGKLVKCRSAHFPNRTTLKRALPTVFQEYPGLTHVVLEGMGNVADIWVKYIQKLNVTFKQVSAETWREDMLYKRDRKSGQHAKHQAEILAADILRENNIHKTSQPNDDEAEAILCGQWAVTKLRNGTFDSLP